MAKRRKRGEGSVHLRKDGRWEGRLVVGYDEKGYPKTRNVLAKTKRECQEKLKQLRETCAPSASPKPEKSKTEMSFGAWMDYWYQNFCKPRLRPATQNDYENNIYRHIIPQLGTIPLTQLTTNDLQQFYTGLKRGGRLIRAQTYGQGLSDRMVRACHANCRTALDKAVEEKRIRSNPAIRCKLSARDRREMQVLTREEMQRFLIQAKEEGYYELFLLELSTGMRRGEILALQWDDLDFRTGELKIQRQVLRIKGKLTISPPKTRASVRTIVLPESILRMLEEYKSTVTSRWMFPSPVKEDSPLDPATCRKRLQTILEHAQCRKVRFHDLRHGFSTMALEHGMDVKTLSAVIGHTSAATTLDIYAHITDDMRRTAALRIDQGIGKREAPISPDATADQQMPTAIHFQPHKNKYRKSGTGCLTQINDHLWEGRYTPTWPDGKRRSRNVYAGTREECEEKLAELIAQMKAEIAVIKARTATE